jgi:hypothetical protein
VKYCCSTKDVFGADKVISPFSGLGERTTLLCQDERIRYSQARTINNYSNCSFWNLIRAALAISFLIFLLDVLSTRLVSTHFMPEQTD